MSKSDKIYYSIAALFFVIIVVADICYLTVSTSQYITKTIASSLFVLSGVFNLVFVIKAGHNNKKLFKIFMMLGLVFGALGDILLIDYFVIGAALFALGHVFYLVAYLLLSKINLKDLLFSLAIIGIALIVIFCCEFDFRGMLPLIIVYAVVISIMLAKALSLIFDKNLNIYSKIIIAVGSFLFFFSDMMLLFNVFGVPSRIFSVLCLATYYPAQFLLSCSIYFVSKNQFEKKLSIDKNTQV